MLSTTDKMIFLRRVPLFGGMALEQLRVLSAHLSEHHYLPDEVVFSEGDFSQELYIVVSGEIAIIKDYGSAHARGSSQSRHLSGLTSLHIFRPSQGQPGLANLIITIE